MTLDEITERLADRLPPADAAHGGEMRARQRALVALSALAARLVMVDMHFSPVEARRLRGAIARVEGLSTDERDAVARLVEEEWQLLREVHVDLASSSIVRDLGASAPTVYDALVDLAAAAGVLHGVYPLMAVFGGEQAPQERAAELGIAVPVEDTFVGVSPESVRYDEQHMMLGDQLYEVTIGWSNLVLLEAIDPWPRVHVSWRERGYPGDAFFTARWDKERFGARIAALFDYARYRLGDHGAHKLSFGWVGRPEVPWERVAELPNEEVTRNDGAYRTSARARPTEPILARREAPGSLEKLMLYLGSSTEARWSDYVGAIVVTDSHLYAELRGGEVGRLPLSTLRSRIGGRDGIYVFGKHTRVMLPQRSGPCPVAQHLDALLRARD